MADKYGRVFRRIVTYEEVDMNTVQMEKVWKALGLEVPARHGPCWCNGPWDEEGYHQDWCRANRSIWRKALVLLRSLRAAKTENADID